MTHTYNDYLHVNICVPPYDTTYMYTYSCSYHVSDAPIANDVSDDLPSVEEPPRNNSSYQITYIQSDDDEIDEPKQQKRAKQNSMPHFLCFVEIGLVHKIIAVCSWLLLVVHIEQ